MPIDPLYLQANPVWRPQPVQQFQQFRPPTPQTPAVQIGPVQSYMNQAAQQYQQASQAQASQARSQQAAANPFIGALQHDAQLFAGAQPQQQGGGGGFLGGLIEAVSTPLNYLAMPGRAVVAGLQEARQAIHGGDADWEEFWRHTRDPSYGYGTAMREEGIDLGKWGNRFMGFVGDVALDPLTYATFGTSKFMGSAGRAGLAQLAQEAGLADDVIAKVGRWGEAALSAAEREQMGIGKAGIRFGIPSANVRIPGTAGIQRAVGAGFGAVRAPFSGTKLAAAARRLGGSRAPELRPFVEALATGRGPMSATQAAVSYGAQMAAPGAEAEYLNTFVRQMRSLGKKLREQPDVLHMVEAGKLTGKAKAWADLTGDMYDTSTQRYGVGLTRRQNFVPHYNTKVFNNFLDNARAEGGDAAALFDDFGDLGAGSGRLMERKFEPGKTYNIRGQDITFDPDRQVTIRDIETKFHDAFDERFPELRGQKLVEDDPEEVLAKLLQDNARDAGEAERIRRLEQGGVVTDEAAARTEKRVAWDQATRAERRQARQVAKARNKQYRDMAARAREHRGVLAEHGARTLRKVVSAEDVLLERAQRLQRLAEGKLSETEARQAEAAARRAALPGEFGALVSGTTPGQRQLETLAAHLNQLDSAIVGLRQKIATSEDPAYQVALRMAQDRRDSLLKQVGEGTAASRKLQGIRSTLRRVEADARARPTRMQDVAQPGEFGPGLERATPETAAYGAQRQAVMQGDFERQVNEMDQAQMRLDALQAAGVPPSGPEYQAAQEALRQATQRRQALLALGAPDISRQAARQAEAGAQAEVEQFGHPAEDFLAQLATLASGQQVRPMREVAPQIKAAGRDATRRKRIIAGLKAITGKSQRITPLGTDAVNRRLTMEQLANPDLLDPEILNLLPENVRLALADEATKLDEMLRPWTARGDPLGLNFRPEDELDWQRALAKPPADVAANAQRRQAIQTKLNDLEAEEDASTRGVKIFGEQAQPRPAQYEMRPYSTEVEDWNTKARRSAQENLADLEARWNEQQWIRTERKRIEEIRTRLNDELRSYRAQGPTQAKRLEHADRNVAEVRQRLADLAERERNLPDEITGAERQELALDMRVAEQRLDELGPTTVREGQVPVRTREAKAGTVESRVQRRPRQVAADPYADQRASLQNEVQILQSKLVGRRPLTEAQGQAQREGRIIPARMSQAQRERAMRALRSVQRQLEELPPPPLSPRQEQIRSLRDELRRLQQGAPGERSAVETDRFAGLGSPMDSPEIRTQADRVARLNDFAVRYKRAIDRGAGEGPATEALVARSVLEDEQRRTLARQTTQRNALGRYGNETEPLLGPGQPKFSDEQIERLVEGRWQREQGVRAQQVQDYAKARKAADDAKAEAKAEFDRAKAAGELGRGDVKAYQARLKEIEAQVPRKPPWQSRSPEVAERMFKTEQRRALERELLPVASATDQQTRDAAGEMLAEFLRPAARTVIDARKQRSFFKKIRDILEAGGTPPPEVAQSLQDLAWDPRVGATVAGEAGRNPYTGVAQEEANRLLGVGGQMDTYAMVQGLDDQLRNRVIEEEAAFGGLLQQLTGSRWRETTGEPKRLFAGGKGLEPLRGAQGPIHPRMIGGRGKGATLSPGRVATVVAGKGQKRGAAFLGALLDEISPAARAQLLDVIERESRQTGRRLNDLDRRLGRLGRGDEQLTGDILDLLVGEGRLGEAVAPTDVSNFYQPGLYRELAGERGALQEAERYAQGLPQPQAPTFGAVSPQAQAELETLARQQSAGRQPALTRREMEIRDLGRTEQAQARLTEQMEPLLEAERRGVAAREQFEALPGLPQEAKDIAENQLLAPDRSTLEALTGNREQVQRHMNLVQERIDAQTKALGQDVFALTDTDKILAGQADERLNDAVAIEEGVRTAQRRVARVKAVSMPAKVNTTGAYEKLVTDITEATASGADDTTLNLLKSAADIIPRMQELDNRAQYLDQMSQNLANGKAIPIIRSVFRDNFQSFATNVTGRKLAIDSTVKDAFDNIDRIVIHAKPGALGKVFDAYTQFFKTYATMSPGFHVRNGLGAIFMNSSDGVGFQNQIAGVRIWSAFRHDPNGEWWKTLPKRYRDVAQDVVRAVYNSGAGGHFSAAEVGAAASGQLAHGLKRFVTQNRAVQFSRRTGEAVEGAVRAGMALDTLLGGGAYVARRGTVGEATSRINRIHFNYNQVSEFDAKMRRLVPFWTFMSRNVPLQIQQMTVNPRTYLHYEAFRKNFNEDQGEAGGTFPFMPKYLRDLGAFRVTPGTALAPEFGPSQMRETISELGSMKMLSEMNPVLKDVGQLVTGKNFFYGSDYADRPYQVAGAELTPFLPLMRAAGMTEELPGWGTAVQSQWADVARDLFPMLGQVNRLGGTTPERKGRTTQAIWNFLGFPGKQMSPEVIAAEMRRQSGSKYYADLDKQRKAEALAELAMSQYR